MKELAFIGLLNSPKKKFGYVVLFNMTKCDEYWRNHLPLVITSAFAKSLGQHVTDLTPDRWVLCLQEAMQNKHKLTGVLQNCCQVWIQVKNCSNSVLLLL